MTAGGFPRAFLDSTTGSFLDFAQASAPQVLPARRDLASAPGEAPVGTTIVALTFAGGVLMAGDRRATIGHQIASRRIEKVFPADRSSLIGIAGTAGLALELVRLFQVELEHYEKIEGAELSLDGRANRLASMLRSQLSLALQGMPVLPLFAGVADDGPRIYSFDVTGGRYSEMEHHSVGSGSGYSRGALKKLWRPGLDRGRAVEVAIEALYDAADDDAATGGPDVGRDIFPLVRAVDATGVSRIPDAEVRDVSQRVIVARTRAQSA